MKVKLIIGVILLGVVYLIASKNTSGVNAQTTTPQNYKVAFVGDTGDGSGFQSVLNLIKSEGADCVDPMGSSNEEYTVNVKGLTILKVGDGLDYVVWLTNYSG